MYFTFVFVFNTLIYNSHVVLQVFMVPWYSRFLIALYSYPETVSSFIYLSVYYIFEILSKKKYSSGIHEFESQHSPRLLELKKA